MRIFGVMHCYAGMHGASSTSEPTQGRSGTNMDDLIDG